MISRNNFEVLKIFQTIFKNKLYRVTRVCLMNQLKVMHMQSLQLKSKVHWGGSIFSVGEGVNCPTLYSLSEYGHCVVVRRQTNERGELVQHTDQLPFPERYCAGNVIMDLQELSTMATFEVTVHNSVKQVVSSFRIKIICLAF